MRPMVVRSAVVNVDVPDRVRIRPMSASAKRHSGDRILFAWPQVQVGAFDCWPGDARWRSENRVEEGHVIAFPGRTVRIAQAGDRSRVMDPTRFVFYNRFQTYRRTLVSRDGDHCTFLVIAPALLDEMARRGVAELRDVERQPFPATFADSGPAEYLEMQAIRHRLDSGDTLEIQERLVRLVERVMTRLVTGSSTGPQAVRPTTRRVRDELAEAARGIVARDPYRPMSLDSVAAELGVSVFHLARVFRQASSSGLHAYRDQLRLRLALPAVLDGSVRMTDLALDAGYASSSHFTDRFRAVYGFAPTQLRRQVAAGHAF